MVIVIPKEIKIGGHTFRIMLDRGLVADGIRAHIDFKRLVIGINPDKKDSIKAEALLHEFFHGVNLIYLNNRIDSDDEIEPLAEGVFQILDQLGMEFDWSGLPDETRD